MSEQDTKTKAKEITNRNVAAARFWRATFERGVDKVPNLDAGSYEKARGFADAATVDADERGCFRADVTRGGG